MAARHRAVAGARFQLAGDEATPLPFLESNARGDPSTRKMPRNQQKTNCD
jgi:hypothetical protein